MKLRSREILPVVKTTKKKPRKNTKRSLRVPFSAHRTIPEEVWRSCIAVYWGASDLLRMRGVCRRWQGWVDLDSSFRAGWLQQSGGLEPVSVAGLHPEDPPMPGWVAPLTRYWGPDLDPGVWEASFFERYPTALSYEWHRFWHHRAPYPDPLVWVETGDRIIREWWLHRYVREMRRVGIEGWHFAVQRWWADCARVWASDPDLHRWLGRGCASLWDTLANRGRYRWVDRWAPTTPRSPRGWVMSVPGGRAGRVWRMQECPPGEVTGLFRGLIESTVDLAAGCDTLLGRAGWWGADEFEVHLPSLWPTYGLPPCLAWFIGYQNHRACNGRLSERFVRSKLYWLRSLAVWAEHLVLVDQAEGTPVYPPLEPEVLERWREGGEWEALRQRAECLLARSPFA